MGLSFFDRNMSADLLFLTFENDSPPFRIKLKYLYFEILR